MTLFQKQLALALAVLVMLGIGAAWASNQAAQSTDEAEAKVKAVVLQRITVAKIKARQTAGILQGNPDLGVVVEQALQTAAIPPQKLLLTSPGTPKAIPGSKQMLQETEIVLKEVTVAQLVPFLVELERQVPGLQLTALNLSASPGGGDPAGQWSARATVTRTISSTSR